MKTFLLPLTAVLGLACSERSRTPPASNDAHATSESSAVHAPAPSTGSATYTVKALDLRCVAAPCPAFEATPEDGPSREEVLVHELDFSGAGLDGAPRKAAEERAAAGRLRVKATLDSRPDAGPAGAAVRLVIQSVL